MKKLILTIIGLTLLLSSSAQVKIITECSSEDVYISVAGDTVVVNCDTVYLMNHERFRNYELMRLTLLKNNNLLFSTISQMKTAYETRIEQQKQEYINMKLLYEECDSQSKGYITKIDNNLKASIISLDKANQKIDSTRDLIKDTQEIIKKDIRKQFGSKLLWGAGGVVIGLGISTAIFLFASN